MNRGQRDRFNFKARSCEIELMGESAHGANNIKHDPHAQPKRADMCRRTRSQVTVYLQKSERRERSGDPRGANED